jgi:hypothetical protein
MQEDIYAWASRDAMEAYARRVEYVNPELAEDLLDWVDREDGLEEGKWKRGRKDVD